MSQLRSRTAKIYHYIPYDDDQQYDKVENSNSRPRTLPGSIRTVKQSSQSEFIDPFPKQGVGITNQPQPLLPLKAPPLWKSYKQCLKCDARMSQIGEKIGINISNNQIVSKIFPLIRDNGISGISYAVEYENGRYEKFTSEALRKWYLQQMVQFLEESVFH